MHDADHQRVEPLRREGGVDVGREFAHLGATADDRLDLAKALATLVLVRRRDAGQLIDQFRLVEDHLEDDLRARVGGKPLQRAHAQVAQCRQRSRRRRFASAFEQRVEGERRAFAHGVEQGRLVLEMPINGAARDACRGRDLGQARPGHAALPENALAGVQQPLPRFPRLQFRPPCHFSGLTQLASVHIKYAKHLYKHP